MNFDPTIVAQAHEFVNNFRKGIRSHVPAMQFIFWQQFMTTVTYELSK